MAGDLNAQKGTYIANEWKDGFGAEGIDYTPITAERLNHIEQGIAANSQDLKTLGDSWDSANRIEGGMVTIPVTASGISTYDIVFSKPFTEVPNVTASMRASFANNSGGVNAVFSFRVYINTINESGVSLALACNSANPNGVARNVCWQAIGK